MSEGPDEMRDAYGAMAAAAGAAGAAADRERTRRILRERAAVLAAKPHDVELEETRELVTLDLAGLRYAIEADMVREVLAVREVAVLPTSPAFVLGLINVRGMVTAVIDLRVVLGQDPVVRSSGQVVIVKSGSIEVAVDVRECGVARVPLSHFLTVADSDQRYVKAVTADQINLLDVDKIIGDTRQSAASLSSGAPA